MKCQKNKRLYWLLTAPKISQEFIPVKEAASVSRGGLQRFLFSLRRVKFVHGIMHHRIRVLRGDSLPTESGPIPPTTSYDDRLLGVCLCPPERTNGYDGNGKCR